MKRTQIFIPDPIMKKLNEISKEKGISKGEIIRRAIEEYLKKLKK